LFRYDKSLDTVPKATFNTVAISLSVLLFADNSATRSLLHTICPFFGFRCDEKLDG
jgi:hypothetical protein